MISAELAAQICEHFAQHRSVAAAARDNHVSPTTAARAIAGKLPIQLRGHHANRGRSLPRHPNRIAAECARAPSESEIAAATSAIRRRWPPAQARRRLLRADARLVRLIRSILEAHRARRGEDPAATQPAAAAAHLADPQPEDSGKRSAD
jgi:hypothetical protein